MRVRDKSYTQSGLSSGTWYRKSDGAVLNSYNRAVSWLVDDRMTDVVVPGFKQKSRDGGIFVNNMTKHKSSKTNLGKSWQCEGQTARFVESVSFTPPEIDFNRVSELTGRLESQAITEAYAAVGEPDLSTLVELAELRETIQFLGSPVRGLIAAGRKAKRYRDQYSRWLTSYERRLDRWNSLPPYRKAKVPKPSAGTKPKMDWGKYRVTDIASLWLAYRYAVMPLIYTFQDVEKTLKRYNENDFPTRATARGKASDVYDKTDYFSASNPLSLDSGSGAVHYEAWVRHKYTISCRAGALYAPDWSLNRQLGVQINRVPAALYELIPLSFVSDWFHNGADVYDALTAEFRAQKIYGAWVTTTIEYIIQTDNQMSPVAGAQHTSVSGGGRTTVAHTVGTFKSRRKASMADVEFQLRLDLNAKRIADGLALASTLLDAAFRKRK